MGNEKQFKFSEKEQIGIMAFLGASFIWGQLIAPLVA